MGDCGWTARMVRNRSGIIDLQGMHEHVRRQDEYAAPSLSSSWTHPFAFLHSSPPPPFVSSCSYKLPSPGPQYKAVLRSRPRLVALTLSVSRLLLLMCIAADPDAPARIAMRVCSATRQTVLSLSTLYTQVQPYVAYFHWYRSDMSLFLVAARLVVPAVAGAVMASLGFLLVSTALLSLWSKCCRVLDPVRMSVGCKASWKCHRSGRIVTTQRTDCGDHFFRGEQSSASVSSMYAVAVYMPIGAARQTSTLHKRAALIPPTSIVSRHLSLLTAHLPRVLLVRSHTASSLCSSVYHQQNTTRESSPSFSCRLCTPVMRQPHLSTPFPSHKTQTPSCKPLPKLHPRSRTLKNQPRRTRHRYPHHHFRDRIRSQRPQRAARTSSSSPRTSSRGGTHPSGGSRARFRKTARSGAPPSEAHRPCNYLSLSRHHYPRSPLPPSRRRPCPQEMPRLSQPAPTAEDPRSGGP